ncbi:MAG: T9SS type A sorting domain-containing protein [Chitinophagaceae bacterium]|jgi:hypothetical protein|nr:T9SS type A sorting domain-containing protein [Chitinophagaceae bacterium]
MKKIYWIIIAILIFGNFVNGQNCQITNSYSGLSTNAFTIIDPNGTNGGTITSTSNGLSFNNVLGGRECRAFVNLGPLNDNSFSAECRVQLTAGNSPSHSVMAFTAGTLDVLSSASCQDQTANLNCTYQNTNQSAIEVMLFSNSNDITLNGVLLTVWTKVGSNTHVQSTNTIAIPANQINDFTVRFERISSTQGRLSYINSSTGNIVNTVCINLPQGISGLNTLQSQVVTAASNVRRLTGTINNIRIFNSCNLNSLVIPSVNNLTTCAGSSVNLSVINPIANNTYVWYTVSSGGTGIIGSNYTTAFLNNTTSYYVSARDNCGQESARKEVVVTVDKASIGGTLSSNRSICSGNNSGTLSLTGNVGNVIRWESSLDNFITKNDISNTTTSLSYSNLTSTISYRAVVKSGVCSSVYSNPVTLTLVQSPLVSPISGLSSVCKNQNITLRSSTPGGTWSISNSNVASLDHSGSLCVVTGLSGGMVTVNYTVSNGICTSNVSKDIVVNDVVSFQINGPSLLCPGTSGNSFSVSPSVNGSDYTWNIQDGPDIGVNFPINGSTECNLTIPKSSINGQFTLRCQGLNACGASPMVTKLISLNPNVPIPNVTCSGINGSNNCVNLSVSNNSGYSISWKVDGVEIGTGTTITRPIGKTVYCYFTSQQGCTNYGYYTPTYICTPQERILATNDDAIEMSKFLVYPNPTEGNLNFTTDGYSGNAIIKNLLGIVVDKIELNPSKTNYTVTMEGKAPGTYSIHFTGGDKEHVTLFVVK